MRPVLLILFLAAGLISAPLLGAHAQTADDSTAARLLKACRSLRDKGQYAAALDSGLLALKLYRADGLRLKVAATKGSIAQVYQLIGEEKHNIPYIRLGLVYATMAYEINQKEVHDTSGMVISRNTQGLIYHSLALQGQTTYYDSALQYYLLGLELIQRSGKGTQYASILYNNVSQCYFDYKKDYPTALHYLQEAVNVNQKNHDTTRLSFNYGNIARIYQLMGARNKSLGYAYKTLALCRQTKMATRLEAGYSQLSDAYGAFGPADSALKYYRLFDNLRDSLSNLAATRQLADAEIKYQAQKDHALITELDTRTRIQQKNIIYLTAGIVALILFLLALTFLLRRVQKQKSLITTQSDQLQTMMRELHHRVKNNLQIVTSLLSLQGYRLRDSEAQEAIRLSQQRVQAMSLIHQRLYTGKETKLVNMEEYLTDLAGSLITAYGYSTKTLALHLDIGNKWLDVDKALPLGLIANEIITNALKHAYHNVECPALDISLRTVGEKLTFTIRDNGGSLDTKEWSGAGGSFGKQLVATLCTQLNATQELALTGGTAFSFTLPHANAA